ncbi:MAG: acyl-CoA/acyl-ACP dehydrogenase [Deltaproteobacteria bacterium]|nr:MAG: acyl-CoA/acyl-ACP dehydrogenase [Deltaproteobacteria bacterium]
MDFSISPALLAEMDLFKVFLRKHLKPNLADWYNTGEIPRRFFKLMGIEGWYGFKIKGNQLVKNSALRESLIQEELAKLSPGIAVAVLAHINLGLTGLFLFGSKELQKAYGKAAVNGDILMCLGNSENKAGSDVSGISMRAEKVAGGWQLNGTKAYVTNGFIADLAVITAVSDPTASRNNRMSMYLVDLNSSGVRRTKLNKQVWIPSDLTRLQLKDVFVPDEHLLGEQKRGLQQVLETFTYSRVPISALTLGTAMGAFELALDRAKKREIFGQKIIDFQAKAFEFADFFARIEAARLMLWRACEAMDNGSDFRQESSLAKYLAVQIAREVTPWAADVFGAVSVVFEHPIHKYPMDAWASSLGEGTQDVQKLVIFRELMKKYS